jgi:glycosyltransferase involved in cell wall biosynthesis
MKISIIIPTFNEEKVISKTIEAFNQLPIPHEIIVTDDGSTDETVNIARRHGVKVLVPTN